MTCADHDILCSFADGSVYPPLHVMVSFIGLNGQKRIFPMAIKIHLFSGQPILFIFSDKRWNDSIRFDGSTSHTAACCYRWPSFSCFSLWLPSHCLLNNCTAQYLLQCHSFVAGLRQGIDTFSVYSENAADVPNGKAWTETNITPSCRRCRQKPIFTYFKSEGGKGVSILLKTFRHVNKMK